MTEKLSQRTPAPIAACLMILMVAGFLVSGVMSVTKHSATLPKPSTSIEYWNGKAALAFEEWFKESLVWEKAAIGHWGALSYAFFNTANKGVVIGKDGWFFTREEFELPLNFSEELATKQEWVQTASNYLKSKGSRLIVVPLPSKARIYRNHLPKGSTLPAATLPIYGAFVTSLRDAKIDVVALDEVMQSLANDRQLFLKTDTHWTPEGAQLTAKAIAAYLDDLEYPHLGMTITKENRSETLDGDLLRFVPTGMWQKWIGPYGEEISRYTLTQQIPEVEGDGALFADAVIPFTLVGTSYSAISTWHFADFLKEALQADVLNVADEGQGPFDPMLTYLKRLQAGDPAPQFVIWEIPERFLHTHYDLDYSPFEVAP
jgi:alginate O-acetyltransferase complex protein AlgJ